MNRIWIVSAMALLCGAGFLVGRVSAEDEMEGCAEMEAPAWTQAGPEHEKLKKMVGNWDVALKFQMSPEEVMESTGKASYQPIMNGFFIEQTFSGTMMDKQFEGRGLYGYDRVNHEYVSTWCDSWSTYLYVSKGKEEGGVTTYTGQEPCYTKEGCAPYKHVVKWDGDNKMIFEMWSTGEDGKLFQMGTITYTRAK